MKDADRKTKSSVKAVKFILESRHSALSSLLSAYFNFQYLPGHSSYELGAMRFFQLRSGEIPVNDNYSMTIDESLKVEDDNLRLFSYSAKLQRIQDNLPCLRYEYRHRLFQKDENDIWIGLPHLHIDTDGLKTISDLSRIHFPTYLAPQFDDSFKHNNDFNMQHNNFPFNFITWVKLEFLARVEKLTKDIKIQRHMNLIQNWQTFANTDLFSVEKLMDGAVRCIKRG